MTSVIRTTVAHAPSIDRAVVEALCAGQATLDLVDLVDARPESLERLGAGREDAIVVACSDESDDALAFIRVAVAQRPERPVVVLYEGTANGFARRAIDAGADDLVQQPHLTSGSDAGAQVAFALEKAVARRAGAQSTGASRGTVTTVLGPKGGTGKTLTACNLSVALAKMGRRVVLVDLDLQFGDVGLSLGLSPERTIYELATAGGSLDTEKLSDFLASHTSGLKVLMAPRRPDQASAVSVEFLRELLDALAAMADHVVLDTPPSFTPEVIASIDRSERICVVAMLDALSLKNTRLALETLDRMRVPSDAISIVLNRADSKVGVSVEDAAALLGRRPDVLVPSSRDITRSVNDAIPIVTSDAGSDAGQAFSALAESIGPAQLVQLNSTTAKRARRSVLRRGKAA